MSITDETVLGGVLVMFGDHVVCRELPFTHRDLMSVEFRFDIIQANGHRGRVYFIKNVLGLKVGQNGLYIELSAVNRADSIDFVGTSEDKAFLCFLDSCSGCRGDGGWGVTKSVKGLANRRRCQAGWGEGINGLKHLHG